MPSARLEDHQVPRVDQVTHLLNEALDHAQSIKPTPAIEPALAKSDFDFIIARLPAIFPCASPEYVSENRESEKTRLYAAVETASRAVFSSLIASTPITSPGFVRVWNLLDILSFLSDNEQCDLALVFWLTEELLDSQTVDGCRNVFDFLESRRERITAKNQKQKALVILRSCNDLLRRLSRAEDAAFCGRVYIFMFQSITFGDKSSVNLRGEYHVENVTAFDEVPSTLVSEEAPEKMDIDPAAEAPKDESKDPKSSTKAVSFDARKPLVPDKPLDFDALYPVFWSLQQSFSQPTTLFDNAQLAKFKNGLEQTIGAFEAVEKLQKSNKTSDDSKIIPQKRKTTEGDEDLRSTNDNPKYLTSRELFELEVSDLYFRRHILIQAFIILDFLLSLTPQAKAKIANVTRNRAVVYAEQTFGEEDAKWARTMKERITTYIQAEVDGYFFFRVVESVISRDKGWVRWKVENCPQIERPSVSPSEFNTARANAKHMATSRRSKPGMTSLSLNFMKEQECETSMEKLKDPSRSKLPDLAEFKDKLDDNDFDLSRANTEKEKTEVLEAKASITWRALRIAKRSKLQAFDKIEDWQNVNVIFQEQSEVEEEGEAGKQPQNTGPVIISGPSGIGKSSLVSMLLEKQKRVFGKILQHTTRAPKDGEVDGRDYHFVDSKTFNQILDGDYFLEWSTRGGFEYGTNRKTIEAMEESGKVPLVRLDLEATQYAKDMGFTGRIVSILPEDLGEFEARLKNADGLSEADIRTKVDAAQAETEQAKASNLFDGTILDSGDLETTYQKLEDFIYQADANGVNGNGVSREEDVAMGDGVNDNDNPS
ncbi:THO complex subunit 1 transcription elongation factor-domain-containing protein [Xylariaceae sp. FL0016]|nr:THO complex subunit 1 transcription elongation factor-domain-containing protein [Xylariaceae sp. FL0016]